MLDESFEGWYQRHAKRTLRDIDKVYAARLDNTSVGLVMLKNLDSHSGYVYYIAVLPEYRGMKIGGRLLDHSLEYFSRAGMDVLFASLTQEHNESNELFKSRGFIRTNYGEISKQYGKIGAVMMYRKMLVVSGELVVWKRLTKSKETSS
ncbi:MAG: GNAT family N-acetyltransferase [Nitrososphaerales archaeon]